MNSTQRDRKSSVNKSIKSLIKDDPKKEKCIKQKRIYENIDWSQCMLKKYIHNIEQSDALQ